MKKQANFCSSERPYKKWKRTQKISNKSYSNPQHNRLGIRIILLLLNAFSVISSFHTKKHKSTLALVHVE